MSSPAPSKAWQHYLHPFPCRRHADCSPSRTTSSTPRPGTAKITQQSQQPLKEQAGHQRYLHTSTILPRSVQMMLAGMLLKRDLGNLLIKAIQTALIDLITYLLGAYLKPPQKILNMSE